MTDDGINPAINSVNLYNGNKSSEHFKLGESVTPTYFYDTSDYSLNETAYNDVAPLHITSMFVVSYMTSFLAIASVLSHVFLWYGPLIKKQVMSALKESRVKGWDQANENENNDDEDIHCKLMKAYPDIPEWMYLSFLAAATVLMIIVVLVTPFKTPVWALFLALIMSLVFIMPVGVINAISGQGIYLNVITEFIIGLAIPGDTVGVMTFKSLGSNNLSQAIGLVSDLKLGHYLVHVFYINVKFINLIYFSIYHLYLWLARRYTELSLAPLFLRIPHGK